MQMPETYGPDVQPFEMYVHENPDGPGLEIFIDGEKQIVDGFEFSAPRGAGLAVKKITRIELVTQNRK